MRLILGLILGFVLASQASAHGFRVVSKKGDVKILPLGSSDWQPLSQRELPHGTLVLVSQGGSLELSHGASAQGAKERLRIEKTMALRLDDEILRNFQYKDYTIDRLFAGSKSELNPVKDKPTLTLKDALQRYMLRYASKEIPKGRQVDPEKPQISAGKTLTPIDLYAPADGSLLYVKEGQAELTARWLALPAARRYLVYSWRATENRGEPLLDTLDTHATVRFQQTGLYRLMVSSEDGTARSPILQIQVLNAKPTSEARESFLKSALRRDKMGLTPTQPAPHAEVLQKDKLSPITFAWKDAQPLGLDETYVLHLKEEQGQAYRIRSLTSWVQTQIPFGRYRWQVTRENSRTGEVSKDSGSSWMLAVKPFTSDALAKSLRDNLLEKTSLRQTIVLDL